MKKILILILCLAPISIFAFPMMLPSMPIFVPHFEYRDMSPSPAQQKIIDAVKKAAAAAKVPKKYYTALSSFTYDKINRKKEATQTYDGYDINAFGIYKKVYTKSRNNNNS